MDPAELESLREDGLDPARGRAFADAERACRRWERDHPMDLEGLLAWIEQLRAAFGDAPVDRTPWRGDDFRL